MVGLAREEVAAARAAVREQPDPGGVPALDLGAVGRRRAGHQRRPSPSRPSGRRRCPRSSRAGCRPGWLRSATRGRSPTRRARGVSSASQRAMLGALPSRMARCSTGSARPSISRKTIPGASVSTRSPERRAMRWITRSVYASSSFAPSDHVEDDARPPRRRARRAAPTRTSRPERALGERVGGQQHGRVDEQDEQEARSRA